jgi:uridylate kinase
MAPAFKRILLKLSGEALMGELEYGTDPQRVIAVAKQVSDVRDQGVEVAIVVGAGNIYRGMQGAAAGMDRATADYMGMLATVLNALPLQDALEKMGTDTRVQSALGVAEVAEPYLRRRELVKVVRNLAEEGRVSIRNVRRDTMQHLRELKSDGEASSDDEHRAEVELQKLTDSRVGDLESLLKAKEEEILEV